MSGVGTDLIAAAAAQGVVLRADGDSILFRPRRKMTPALAKRLADHRHEILAALRQREPSVVDGHGRLDSAHAGAPPRGSLPSGWSLLGWRRHLLNMAEACQQLHPSRAVELTKEAHDTLTDDERPRFLARSDELRRAHRIRPVEAERLALREIVPPYVGTRPDPGDV